MGIWLNLLQDYEGLEKEKKAKAASEKGQKGHVFMLRERINQTIRERRAAEQLEKELGSDTAAGDSSQPPEQPQPVPTTIKNRRSGNHLVKDDKAFAS